MARELNVKIEEITKFGGNSYIISGDARGGNNEG
jgi:hypothetical protein